MKNDLPTAALGPREREILEVLFRMGEATASEVRVRLRGQPSDSSVRTMLTLLETKGHVRHRRDGRVFVYSPAKAREAVQGTALRHVIETFFAGSVSAAITTLVRDAGDKLTRKDVDRLKKLIEELPEE
jgi:predicted transcriptional regulator